MRISFYGAVISCRHLQATLVLPNLWQAQHDRWVAFSRLWDAGHLIEHAAASGVSLLLVPEEARKEMCPSESENITCMTPQHLFYHAWKFELTEEESHYQDTLQMHKTVANSLQFAEARKWLKPASYFEDRAQAVVGTLLGDNEAFDAAVHLRTEGDFVHACTVWPRIDGLRCMMNDVEIAEALQGQGVAPGCLLYIFPSAASEAVSTLCQQYRCTHRGEVDAAEDLLYNERALLDFSIAVHASAAYGNIYSTMSVELVATMRAEGKPAAFLNPPCPADPINGCP